MCAWSKTLWPVRPKPLRGEIASSWISRIANGLGFSLQEFCRLHLPRSALSKGDLDLVADPILFKVLGDSCGIDPRVARLTSVCFDTSLAYTKGSSERIRWIVPFEAKDAVQGDAALPYCPACLALDEIPHYRKVWRYAFFTICPVHGWLSDKCPSCGGPYNYLGPDRIVGSKFRSGQLDRCQWCNKKFVVSPQPVGNDELSLELIRIQETLLSAVHKGWIDVDNRDKVLTLLFMDGLSQVSTVFLQKDLGPLARDWMCRSTELEIPNFPASHWVGWLEKRPIIIRAFVLLFSTWLIREWPHRFVRFCRELRIPAGRIFLPPNRRPFWLLDPDIDMLAGARTSHSTEEVASARYILGKRLGYAPSNADLVRFLASGQIPTSVLSGRTSSKSPSSKHLCDNACRTPFSSAATGVVQAAALQRTAAPSSNQLRSAFSQEMDLEEASADIPALEMQQRKMKSMATSG